MRQDVERSPVAPQVGLGLRRGLLPSLDEPALGRIDFLELAPENWMQLGGRLAWSLRALSERVPFTAHGLSLNLGGSTALEPAFLTGLRHFLDEYRIDLYSEHLSACADGGFLHDLIPLPFTTETLRHVSSRLHQVQDALARPVMLENISAYLQWPGDFDEAGFLAELVKTTGCQLLLDINNVWVNGCNQGQDARHLIASLPRGCVAAYHLAGHHRQEDGLLIDTHGEAVCDEVHELFRFALDLHGHQPVVLERDFNLPPLAELLDELDVIRRIRPSGASP